MWVTGFRGAFASSTDSVLAERGVEGAFHPYRRGRAVAGQDGHAVGEAQHALPQRADQGTARRRLPAARG